MGTKTPTGVDVSPNGAVRPPVVEGYALTWGPVRWAPYKPTSQQFKRGVQGRWQQLNEYAGWDNCSPPGRVYDGPPDYDAVAAERDIFKHALLRAQFHPETPDILRYFVMAVLEEASTAANGDKE